MRGFVNLHLLTRFKFEETTQAIMIENKYTIF